MLFRSFSLPNGNLAGIDDQKNGHFVNFAIPPAVVSSNWRDERNAVDMFFAQSDELVAMGRLEARSQRFETAYKLFALALQKLKDGKLSCVVTYQNTNSE